MSDSRKLIVVLGAHRSGTSLCAAAIESLGADPCLGEIYTNVENRKGFFEHPDVVAFNDRLLEWLGGSWDNPLFDGGSALAGRSLDPWFAQGLQLLDGIFGNTPIAVLKDPRICQLLSFWAELIRRAGYAASHIYYVHTVRDPVEVALSQKKRAADNPAFYEFGTRLAEGAALWLSLTGQALHQGSGLNTKYVAYSRILAEPSDVLTELGSFLEIRPQQHKLERFTRDFVDPSLYRSTADEAASAELARELPQALELYTAMEPLWSRDDTGVIPRCLEIFRREDTRRVLQQIASPALSRLSTRCRADSLDLIRARETVSDLEQQIAELKENSERVRREHRAVVEPLRGQLKTLESGNLQLQVQLGELSAEHRRAAEENRRTIDALHERAGHLEEDIAYLSGQIRQMEESLSWRVTRPLRALNARMQRLRSWRAQRWGRFRLRAILVYHRMSLRHAGLAYLLRRGLRPVFRALNRLLGGPGAGAHALQGYRPLNPLLYQQTEASGSFTPLVSVIVPNFNHAPYLRIRLDSIFSQTYRNFEVILLDDASTDDSVSILRDYQQRYPQMSMLVVNEENSGGVFHQWERGLNLAHGDIVWIAESDDWCTDNFLETLVPFFENEAVQIAYARTVFMDGDGEQQIWSINEYLHDIDPQRWNSVILEAAPAIVREAFGVKNIIPNVSSALMRTPRQLEILADPEWRGMRTCGDWVLYLHLLRGGMLAYSPAACNYYRMHGKNTSVDSYRQDEFYREHEVVARTLRQYYDVPDTVLERLRDNLEIHWRETRGAYSDEALERSFSIVRLTASTTPRKPNLLMASYAFCAGGGETFPISLANIMKGYGYNVTYLDCAREPRLDGVRYKLRPDIPVVSDFTQLERIVDDFDIDVVHSHHAWVDNTVLDLLPATARCKTVVTLHGMYETINDYDLRTILPRLVERSAALIYVAEKNLDAIRSRNLLERASVTRIDNALQPEPFDPVSREALGIPEDAFVLTLVSRGLVEKGWGEAIEAVAEARALSRREIHLVLVGDGPEYERLAKLSLPEFVHLEGFQQNVRGYFALADLGILPSRFRGESFPLVIVECLQSGTPFLASDLGEIRRMLQGESGMAGAVVPLRNGEIDLSALVSSIVEFSVDPNRYQSLKDALPDVVSKFDPAVMARQHDMVYESVVDSQSGRRRAAAQ